ncbi:hypothetical protein DPV79_09970 [Burkholderia reimsis]|uniref:Uncharacterized protein n=1 Tax=Burkholderia reimsis TaxID=2234132 RepID=A0A365QYI2_9BURK|nr:hypothetical protein DPV79_09970 [Burkholderia reimsis]
MATGGRRCRPRSLPVACYQLMVTGNRQPATGNRLTAYGLRLTAYGLRLPATGYRLPATGYRRAVGASVFPCRATTFR